VPSLRDKSHSPIDSFNRRSDLPLPSMVSVPDLQTKRLIRKPLSLDDIPSYETDFIDYSAHEIWELKRSDRISTESLIVPANDGNNPG
jgi:hypothetical protein